MTQRLLAIIVSLWLSFISGLSAQQVGLHLPSLNNVSPSTTILVPVTVTNFDSITSIQFVLQWNPQVLSTLQVLTFNLPNMSISHFNMADTASGLLRFVYEAPNLNAGVSKSDGATIFRLSFYVAGQINDSSVLQFAGIPPTEFEISQVGHPQPYTLDSCEIDNGFVAVGYTVSAADPVAGTFPVKIFPNPFPDATTAFFELKTGENVQFLLTDMTGKTLNEKKIWLPAGQHGMEIASDQLQENGIYYLIIRTATQSCIRSLVKL